MNESIRTLIFVALASVAGFAAWQTRPNLDESGGPGGVEPGTLLFPDFKDPLAARSLQVVSFDEASAAFKDFEVAQKNGRWVIPSHDDYPADAANQLRDAATALIDLEALAIISNVRSEHRNLGVVEPSQTELKAGDQGVGKLIVVQDSKGEDLLRLIVGKKAEGPDGSESLHFVRKPSEDLVYVTKIDLTKLPTEFDNWIEKDLLKLSPFDVSKVTLKDYSILPTTQGPQLLLRMEATLTYDNAAEATKQWTLDKMSVFSQRGDERDGSLTELEELNRQKLDDLRNALDDLRIVNVARKPADLVKQLKEGADVEPEQLEALTEFGFELGPGQGGKYDVYGSSGELVVDMKDGVRYTLRFGKIAGAEQGSSSSEASAGSADDAVKVNRFLFVAAQLSPTTLTPPVLEPEPAGPEAPGSAPPAATPPADAANENASQPGGGDAEAQQDDPKAADAKPAEAPQSDDNAESEGAAPAEPAADPAAAERARVKRENERKMNEYRDKRRQAEIRVRELNARFADWYYVVSEDVYKKLRLSRSDFVKEGAAAAEEGFGIDAFRKLEEGPAAKAAPPASAAPPAFPPMSFPPMP